MWSVCSECQNTNHENFFIRLQLLSTDIVLLWIGYYRETNKI